MPHVPSPAGECVDQNVCACYPGYTGSTCDVDCGCNGYGRCTNTNSSSGGGAPTCICDVGWRLGPNGCEWDCRQVPCVGWRCEVAWGLYRMDRFKRFAWGTEYRN